MTKKDEERLEERGVEVTEYTEPETVDVTKTAAIFPATDPSGEPMEVAISEQQQGDLLAEAGYVDGEPPAEAEELAELEAADDDV